MSKDFRGKFTCDTRKNHEKWNVALTKTHEH